MTSGLTEDLVGTRAAEAGVQLAETVELLYDEPGGHLFTQSTQRKESRSGVIGDYIGKHVLGTMDESTGVLDVLHLSRDLGRR